MIWGCISLLYDQVRHLQAFNWGKDIKKVKGLQNNQVDIQQAVAAFVEKEVTIFLYVSDEKENSDNRIPEYS